MTFLTRNFIKIFLLKMSYKNSFVNFDTFPTQNGSFIFPQNRSFRGESVEVYKQNMILQKSLRIFK